MGTPDEVALSWKQLGNDDKSQGWDSPALNPPPQSPRVSQRGLWTMLGIVTAILAAIIIVPWTVWSISTAPGKTSEAKPVDTTNILIEAARNGHLETLQSLLADGAAIDAQDSQGMTALHHAAKNGHNGAAELLIKRGARTDIRDRAGKTAADYASAGGHQETLNAILGLTPIAITPQGWVPSEKPNELQADWFQAGSDHANYSSGTYLGVGGIEKAMFIRGRNSSATGFSTVMREDKADRYRGQRVKLSATIKTEISSGRAAMWLRIDAADGSVLGFDNMEDRPILGTTDTKKYTIELDVPPAAAMVAYGVLFQGEGTVYFGDIGLR
jgi:hypothetical protein